MRFVAYFLPLESGYLYTGSTGNLTRRLKAHRKFKCKGAKVVYRQSFGSREEALACEKQWKGWTRAKKEAKIAGAVGALEILSKRRGGRPLPPHVPKACPEVPAP